MKQRFFLNKKALNWENLRIWHTHYKPKPAHDNVPNWQAYLEWYRQVVVEVLEIAAETGWGGRSARSGLSGSKVWRKGDMMAKQHPIESPPSPDRGRSAEW
jgi:hypothetical protein